MGHARCEELMGFNMGPASVWRGGGGTMLLGAVHRFCEAKLRTSETWEPTPLRLEAND